MMEEGKEEPLQVNSIAEEYAHIAALRCERCGGTYAPARQSLLLDGEKPMDVIEAVCRGCGHRRRISFDISSFFGR